MSLEGAKFICLDEAGNHCEIVMAKGRKFTLGYYVNCDFVLIDERAKGVHCEIECDAFGRVTIRNLSPDKPILVNGSAVEVKRSLLNNSRLSILDKEYLWLFPKSSSSEFENIVTDDACTPQKHSGITEQAPNSCPDFKLHRELPKRFTVHNFAYCIQSDEEGNISSDSNNESNTEELSRLNENLTEDTTDKKESANKPATSTEDSQKIRLTPEPGNEDQTTTNTLLETPKMDLINCTIDKENKSTQKKNKQMLTLCHQSDVVITSFSPRETGVKIEKSFATVIKPKVLVTKPPPTPKSVYSTPKSDLFEIDKDNSVDLINFYTPSTSKKDAGSFCISTASKVLKNSSMHLIDLTTPGKLKPTTQYLKSTMKGSAKKNLSQCVDKSSGKLKSEDNLGIKPLPLTPVTNEITNSPSVNSSSVITVSSVDNSSVIEVTSDVSSVGITPISSNVLKTPTKSQTRTAGACTPKRTPQSLMKRALLTSAKKQITTPQKNINNPVTQHKEAINRIPLRSPVTPKAATRDRNTSELPRRKSMSTPTRKSTSTQNLFDNTPSSSKLTTALKMTSRRSSINPISGVRNLPTSTPLDGFKTNTSLKKRTACKTPLHTVCKSISGIPLSSHISKSRKSIVLPASTSKITSIKEKSPQQIMSNRLVSRARKSLGIISSISMRTQNKTTESKTPIQTSIRKTVLFADQTESNVDTDDLNRTFVVDSGEGENAIAAVEKKSKDATFSPAKDKSINLDNQEHNVEIPVDVDEISDTIKNHHKLSSEQNVIEQKSIENNEQKFETVDVTNNSKTFDKTKPLVTEESFAEIISITPIKETETSNLIKSIEIFNEPKESLQIESQENVIEAKTASEETAEKRTVITVEDSINCLAQDKNDKTEVTDVGFGEESSVEVIKTSNKEENEKTENEDENKGLYEQESSIEENNEKTENEDKNKVLNEQEASIEDKEDSNKDNVENNSSFANIDGDNKILKNSFIELESTVNAIKESNKESNQNKDLDSSKSVPIELNIADTKLTRDETISDEIKDNTIKEETSPQIQQNLSKYAEEVSVSVTNPTTDDIIQSVKFEVNKKENDQNVSILLSESSDHVRESTKNKFIQDSIVAVFKEESSIHIESKDEIQNESTTETESVSGGLNVCKTEISVNEASQEAKGDNEIKNSSPNAEDKDIPNESNINVTELSTNKVFPDSLKENNKPINMCHESDIESAPNKTVTDSIEENNIKENVSHNEPVTESVDDESMCIKTKTDYIKPAQINSPIGIHSATKENNKKEPLLELVITETETEKTKTPLSMCDNKDEILKNEQNKDNMNERTTEEQNTSEYKPIYEDITLEGSLIEKEMENTEDKNIKRPIYEDITLEGSLIEEHINNAEKEEINTDSNTILLKSENIEDNASSSTQCISTIEKESILEENIVDEEYCEDTNLKNESFENDFENTNKLLEEIEDVLNKSDEIKQKHLTEVEENEESSSNKPLTEEYENQKDTQTNTLVQTVKDVAKITSNNDDVSCVTTPRRRSTRRASQSTEVKEEYTETSFTPRRSARRASMSAETNYTFTPTKKSRRASVSAINEATLTPKLTRRRTSMSVHEEDSEPSTSSKTPKSKTPRKLSEHQIVISQKLEDVTVPTIIEEEEEIEKSNEQEDVIKQVFNEECVSKDIAIEVQVEEDVVKSEKAIETKTEHKNLEKENQLNENEIVINHNVLHSTENPETETKSDLEIPEIKNISDNDSVKKSEIVQLLSDSSFVATNTDTHEEDKEENSSIINGATLNKEDLSKDPIKSENTEKSHLYEDSPSSPQTSTVSSMNKVLESPILGMDSPGNDNDTIESLNFVVEKENSPKTPLRSGVRELLKTPNVDFNTPVLVGEQELLCTPEKKAECVLEDTEKLAAKTQLAEETPNKSNSKSKQILRKSVTKEVLGNRDNSPKTPIMKGMRELLKTPKAEINTPNLIGIRNMIQTPKVKFENEDEKTEILSSVAELVNTPHDSLYAEEILEVEPSTSKTNYNLKGVKELLKTPKTSATPRFKGMRELMQTPKVCLTPQTEGIKELMNSPNPEIKSESESTLSEDDDKIKNLKENDQIDNVVEATVLDILQKPEPEALLVLASTSKNVGFKEVKELLKTPKISSTPRLRGIRELMQTPKVCSTPLMEGIKELIDSPAPQSTNEFDKFLRTPTAKNLMIPSMPSSAVIEKSSDSIEISTEYDLNATNEGQTSNLDDLFKTPVPSCFAERITDSYYGEEADQGNSEENIVTNKKETLQDKLNKSAEEAFDKLIGQENQIQTPVRKTYNRKPSFDLNTPKTQSPFTACDVLSDMPKTDIEEWIETLGDAEPPSMLECDDSETTDAHQEDVSYLEQFKLEVTADESIIPETCTKVYLNEKTLKNVANTPTMSFETKDPLASNASKSKEKETRPITPIDADISGIDLLDQTIESAAQDELSMLDEPLLVDDPSILEEALVVSDDSGANDTLQNNDSDIEANKEVKNTTSEVILELSEEDANDLTEPLVLSDSDDLSQSQEICTPTNANTYKQYEKFTNNETLQEKSMLENESDLNTTRKDDPLETKDIFDQEHSVIFEGDHNKSTTLGDNIIQNEELENNSNCIIVNDDKVDPKENSLHIRHDSEKSSSKDMCSTTPLVDKIETVYVKETEVQRSAQEFQSDTEQGEKSFDILNKTITQTAGSAVEISIEETNVLSKKSDVLFMDTSVTEIFEETNITTTEEQIENKKPATTGVFLKEIMNNQDCTNIFADSDDAENSQIDESFADEATNEENDVENETAMVEVTTIEDNSYSKNKEDANEIEKSTHNLNMEIIEVETNNDVENKCNEIEKQEHIEELENIKDISSSDLVKDIQDSGAKNLDSKIEIEAQNTIQFKMPSDDKELEKTEESEKTFALSTQTSHSTANETENINEPSSTRECVVSTELPILETNTTTNEPPPLAKPDKPTHLHDNHSNSSLKYKLQESELKQRKENDEELEKPELFKDASENKDPSEAEVENKIIESFTKEIENTVEEAVLTTTEKTVKQPAAKITKTEDNLNDPCVSNEDTTTAENNKIITKKTSEMNVSLPLRNVTSLTTEVDHTDKEKEHIEENVIDTAALKLDDEILTSNPVSPTVYIEQTQLIKDSTEAIAIPVDVKDTEINSLDYDATTIAPIQKVCNERIQTEDLHSPVYTSQEIMQNTEYGETASCNTSLTSEIVKSYDFEVKVSDLDQPQQVNLKASTDLLQPQYLPSSEDALDNIPATENITKSTGTEEHNVEKTLIPDKIIEIQEHSEACVEKVEIDQSESKETKPKRIGRSKKRTPSESSQGSIHEDNTSSSHRESRRVVKKSTEEMLIEEDDQQEIINVELLETSNQFDKLKDVVKCSRKRNASESSQGSINNDENRTSTRKTRRKIQKVPVEESVLEQQEYEEVKQPKSCPAEDKQTTAKENKAIEENNADISSKEIVSKNTDNNEGISDAMMPASSKNTEDVLYSEESSNSVIHKDSTSRQSKEEPDKPVNDENKISSDFNNKLVEKVPPTALIQPLELNVDNTNSSNIVEKLNETVVLNLKDDKEDSKNPSVEIKQQNVELPSKTLLETHILEEKISSEIPTEIVSSFVEVEQLEVDLTNKTVSDAKRSSRMSVTSESSISSAHVDYNEIETKQVREKVNYTPNEEIPAVKPETSSTITDENEVNSQVQVAQIENDVRESNVGAIPSETPLEDVETVGKTVKKSRSKPTVSASNQTSIQDESSLRSKRLRRKASAEQVLNDIVASEISTHNEEIKLIKSGEEKVEVQAVAVEETKEQLPKRSRRVPTVSESSQDSIHDNATSHSRRVHRKLQKPILEEKVTEETDVEICKIIKSSEEKKSIEVQLTKDTQKIDLHNEEEKSELESTQKTTETKSFEDINAKPTKGVELNKNETNEIVLENTLEDEIKTTKDKKETDDTEEMYVESEETKTAITKRGRRKALPVCKEPLISRRGRRKVQEASAEVVKPESEKDNKELVTKISASEHKPHPNDSISEEPSTSQKALRKVHEASDKNVIESLSTKSLEIETITVEDKDFISTVDEMSVNPIQKQPYQDIVTSEVKQIPKRVTRRRKVGTPEISKVKDSVKEEESASLSHADHLSISEHKELSSVDEVEPENKNLTSGKIEKSETSENPDSRNMVKSDTEFQNEPETEKSTKHLRRARTASETSQDLEVQIDSTKRQGRHKLTKKEKDPNVQNEDKNVKNSIEILPQEDSKEKLQRSSRRKAIATHKSFDEHSLKTDESSGRHSRREENDDHRLSENTDDVLSGVHVTEANLQPEESTDDHTSAEKNRAALKGRRGRKKQMEKQDDLDLKPKELEHEESDTSSKRRVVRRKANVEDHHIEEQSTHGKASNIKDKDNNKQNQENSSEQELNSMDTNIISVGSKIQPQGSLNATENIKDENKKGRSRGKKHDQVEENQPQTTSHSSETQHKERQKESHVTAEEDNSEKISVKKVDLSSRDNEPQTPQRVGAVGRRGRKASCLDKESHEHITAESNDFADTPGRKARNVPQRKVATAYHNYDETSDSEIQTKSKKKTDSPRKSLESSKSIPTIAITATPITDSTPSTSNTASTTTARGRTRKPTARVQQFLEEERAKAETPKKRALLAAIAKADESTTQRTPARRGRKPSTLDTETEGTPLPSKGRGRGRPAAVSKNKEENTTDEKTVVVEEKKEEEKLNTTPSVLNLGKERKGRKAKLTEEAHNKADEPPAKKSSVESESDKQNFSPTTDGQTPTRTTGKRNAAAAAKARIEEDALAAAALDPPKRGRAKKVPKVLTKFVSENDDHSSETEAKNSLQRREQLLNSASTSEGGDENDNVEKETLEKPVNKRGARKLIDTPTTASPAPPAKKSRKVKIVADVIESETVNDTKTLRGRGRKNEHQPTETATSTQENTNETKPTESVETVAEPVKRSTRLRRK